MFGRLTGVTQHQTVQWQFVPLDYSSLSISAQCAGAGRCGQIHGGRDPARHGRRAVFCWVLRRALLTDFRAFRTAFIGSYKRSSGTKGLVEAVCTMSQRLRVDAPIDDVVDDHDDVADSGDAVVDVDG